MSHVVETHQGYFPAPVPHPGDLEECTLCSTEGTIDSLARELEGAKAASRACDRPIDDYEFNHTGSCLVSAAREALAPLKDIHRPFTRDYVGGDGRTVCSHCLGPVDWPCLTARLVYAEEEL